MKKYLLPLILILLITFTLIGDCWVSGYDQRIKVTTDHTKVDAALSNFPVTAFFTSTQAEEIFVEFDADEDFDRGQFALGNDTLLYADCELFDDSAQKGIYHFKVTSVSSSVGTDIYFYYDNDHAHNTTYISKSGGTAAQSVYDANFKAVYHMNDQQSLPDFYDTQYEATVEPDSDGWVLGGTDYASVSAGILTIDTSGSDSYLCNYYKTPNVDFNGGFYLKTRIKASTSMVANDDYLEIDICDGTQNEYTFLYVYDGKITWQYDGGVGTYTVDTTTDYHVYEVYIKGTAAKIYVDEIERASYTVEGSSVDDLIRFGDLDAAVMCKIEMDYLYYTLGVADNPVVTILDSTSNNNNGTKKSANEPVEATGKVGQAQEFDYSDDYIQMGDVLDVGASDFTIEALVERDTATTAAHDIFTKYWGVDGERSYMFYALADDTLSLITSSDGSDASIAGSDGTVDTSYHYCAVSKSSTTASFYIDGTASGSGTAKASCHNNVNYACIGTQRKSDGSVGNFMDGEIDEVRVSFTARNAAWIKATYNSLWDTLLTYGSEETSEEDNAVFFGTNF